jgi:hypothetical protein
MEITLPPLGAVFFKPERKVKPPARRAAAKTEVPKS